MTESGSAGRSARGGVMCDGGVGCGEVRQAPEPEAVLGAAAGRRAGIRWRGALAVALLVAAGGTLTGCALPGEPDGTGPTQFVAGTSTVTVFAPDQRGEPMALAGADTAGAAVDVAQWRGDVVVVNVWYAACGPCRAEAPVLVAAAQEFAVDGVKFVGLNTRDDAGSAAAFERTFNVPYPSIMDSGGKAAAGLPDGVSVQAVPTTLVVDVAGRVAAQVLGTVERSVLDPLIQDVLDEGTETGATGNDPSSSGDETPGGGASESDAETVGDSSGVVSTSDPQESASDDSSASDPAEGSL